MGVMARASMSSRDIQLGLDIRKLRGTLDYEGSVGWNIRHKDGSTPSRTMDGRDSDTAMEHMHHQNP
jgi:hypothetical protein